MSTALLRGRLLRRYQRFLADVELEDGRVLTAHCPNTGSMLGLLEPGSRCLLSLAANPRRKLAHTLEVIECRGVPVLVNTHRANGAVAALLASGRVAGLPVDGWQREQTRGDARLDFVHPGPPETWLEVKSVTLARDGLGRFPDAPSLRGRRHVENLLRGRQLGRRCVLFYAVMRGDVNSVAPAADIDPAYADAVRRAVDGGVECLAWRFLIGDGEALADRPLPVLAGAASPQA